MYRITLITAWFLIISMFSQAQTPTISLFDKLTFNKDADSLPYRLLKPVNPDAFDKFPLVIFLHGAGERGSDNEAQIKHITELFLNEQYRGKYPCYLIAPQCPKGQWWANFDRQGSRTVLKNAPTAPMQLVIDLIEKVIQEYPIDTTRIYITGLSMGGYGTWELIARLPQKFAAAVPVCGGGAPALADNIKHIPIWAFHGAQDTVVPPRESREMINALRIAGALPGYNEYPDVAHESWIHAYREPHLMHWLFKQKRGNRAKGN